MPMFTKKPVSIEARQFKIEEQYKVSEFEKLADWCGGKACGICSNASDWVIKIETLEGEMEAKQGDWIIKGVKGEFYPCKPDVFEATYDPA